MNLPASAGMGNPPLNRIHEVDSITRKKSNCRSSRKCIWRLLVCVLANAACFRITAGVTAPPTAAPFIVRQFGPDVLDQFIRLDINGERCNSVDEGSRASRFSLGGLGHSLKECADGCVAQDDCNAFVLTARGYCHMFQSCSNRSIDADSTTMLRVLITEPPTNPITTTLTTTASTTTGSTPTSAPTNTQPTVFPSTAQPTQTPTQTPSISPSNQPSTPMLAQDKFDLLLGGYRCNSQSISQRAPKFSPGRSGHSLEDCAWNCLAQTECTAFVLTAKGYCHMFQSCEDRVVDTDATTMLLREATAPPSISPTTSPTPDRINEYYPPLEGDLRCNKDVLDSRAPIFELPRSGVSLADCASACYDQVECKVLVLTMRGFCQMFQYCDSMVFGSGSTTMFRIGASSLLSGSTSEAPTAEPTVSAPTIFPTLQPSTPSPSANPTRFPTFAAPSNQPSEVPTSQSPTDAPTAAPVTPIPSAPPTDLPTNIPSFSPSSGVPSKFPTVSPITSSPSSFPSAAPSLVPSVGPTQHPSQFPTFSPSIDPCLQIQCSADCQMAVNGFQCGWDMEHNLCKTGYYTSAFEIAALLETMPGSCSHRTLSPSIPPTLSAPTTGPTYQPTSKPSAAPSMAPTQVPSASPSTNPSKNPSAAPTELPSISPSSQPSISPTEDPCLVIACSLDCYGSIQAKEVSFSCGWDSESNLCRTEFFSTELERMSLLEAHSGGCAHRTPPPSVTPTTSDPSQFPTVSPSSHPTVSPTQSPSRVTTHSPSVNPTLSPTSLPTRLPSQGPTIAPTSDPCLRYRCSADCANSIIIDSTTFECGWNSEENACLNGFTSTVAELTALLEFEPGDCAHRTRQPSSAPTTSSPSSKPTFAPSVVPSVVPSKTPTNQPSSIPSTVPSYVPSSSPTYDPCLNIKCSRDCIGFVTSGSALLPCGWDNSTSTCRTGDITSAAEWRSMLESNPGDCSHLTASPTPSPTLSPSSIPSKAPSLAPTITPSTSPTLDPCLTTKCSADCTGSRISEQGIKFCGWDGDTNQCRAGFVSSENDMASLFESMPGSCSHHTSSPSYSPSSSPSTSLPTVSPSKFPSLNPTQQPSLLPTMSIPSAIPTSTPSELPTNAPSIQPTRDSCLAIRCSLDCHENSTTIARTTIVQSCGWDSETDTCRSGHLTSPEEAIALLETSPGDCSAHTAAPTSNPTLTPSVPPTLLPTFRPTSVPSSIPMLDLCRHIRCSTDCINYSFPGGLNLACGWDSEKHLCRSGSESTLDEIEAALETSPGDCSHVTGAPSTYPSQVPFTSPTELPSKRPTSSHSTLVPSVKPTFSTPSLSPSESPSSIPSISPTIPVRDPCLETRCSNDCKGYRFTYNAWFECGWDQLTNRCRSGFQSSQFELSGFLEMTPGACSHHSAHPTTSTSVHIVTMLRSSAAPTITPTSVPTITVTDVDTSSSNNSDSNASINWTLVILGLFLLILICVLVAICFGFRWISKTTRPSFQKTNQEEPLSPQSMTSPAMPPNWGESHESVDKQSNDKNPDSQTKLRRPPSEGAVWDNYMRVNPSSGSEISTEPDNFVKTVRFIVPGTKAEACSETDSVVGEMVQARKVKKSSTIFEDDSESKLYDRATSFWGKYAKPYEVSFLHDDDVNQKVEEISREIIVPSEASESHYDYAYCPKQQPPELAGRPLLQDCDLEEIYEASTLPKERRVTSEGVDDFAAAEEIYELASKPARSRMHSGSASYCQQDEVAYKIAVPEQSRSRTHSSAGSLHQQEDQVYAIATFPQSQSQIQGNISGNTGSVLQQEDEVYTMATLEQSQSQNHDDVSDNTGSVHQQKDQVYEMAALEQSQSQNHGGLFDNRLPLKVIKEIAVHSRFRTQTDDNSGLDHPAPKGEETQGNPSDTEDQVHKVAMLEQPQSQVHGNLFDGGLSADLMKEIATHNRFRTQTDADAGLDHLAAKEEDVPSTDDPTGEQISEAGVAIKQESSVHSQSRMHSSAIHHEMENEVASNETTSEETQGHSNSVSVRQTAEKKVVNELADVEATLQEGSTVTEDNDSFDIYEMAFEPARS